MELAGTDEVHYFSYWTVGVAERAGPLVATPIPIGGLFRRFPLLRQL